MITLALLAGVAVAGELPLWNVTPATDLAKVDAHGVTITYVRPGTVRVESGHAMPWPGVTLPAPGGHWDLSRYSSVALDVANLTTTPISLGLRVDNPGGDGGKNCVQDLYSLAAGQRTTLAIKLTRKFPADWGLFGMNGYPGGGTFGTNGHAVDPANMTQAIIFLDHPTQDHAFEMGNLRATGAAPPVPKRDGFFPFIDEFGQFIHKEWPGKIHAAADFAARRTAEEADLAAHPAPADRDRWGGWAAGPRLKASGRFRVEQRGGRWWFVDPDGRLFWSYGVTCVGHWAAGPIADRDTWYRGMPADDPAFKTFFWDGDARADERYKGRKVRYFDWAAANAFRKYGTAWEDSTAAMAHRRLASWGFNSTGAWSQSEFYLKRRTPYTVIVHPGGTDLEASEGYWSRFRDVFDPTFRKAVREALAGRRGESGEDPWCIGFFVDNELSWGNETDMGVWTLASPPTQEAKRVVVKDLRKKYGTIAKLNAAWGTAHPSWDALLAARGAPDREKAGDDLRAITAKTAATYFKVCREEVKRVAPKSLYLGCRFAWVNDLAIRAAAREVDVLSFNLYRRDVGDFALPAGVDLPVVIGEYHCGALDRGLFHTGLQGADDQAGRAKFLEDYVDSALRNPAFVGCHWFQYLDEPTTGRFDGENYQIGMLDVCDTPYPETIAAARAVGSRLYVTRAGR